MTPLDGLTFQQLLRLLPVLFALHNAEEAPNMPHWQRKIGLSTTLTTRQFIVAVAILTLAVFVVTVFATQEGSPEWLTTVMLAIQMTIFVNAFVPHLTMAIRHRAYNPGLLTAILVNIPFSVYLMHRALIEAWISWGELLLLLIAAPFIMLAALGLTLGIQRVRLFRQELQP